MAQIQIYFPENPNISGPRIFIYNVHIIICNLKTYMHALFIHIHKACDELYCDYNCIPKSQISRSARHPKTEHTWYPKMNQKPKSLAMQNGKRHQLV